MPINPGGSSVFLAGFKTPLPMVDVYLPRNQPGRYVLSGVTYDDFGAVIGGVTVDVFETASNRLIASVVSDASGNYSADVNGVEGITLFANGYKVGSPDVAGTTRNDLVPTPT